MTGRGTIQPERGIVEDARMVGMMVM